ncbi:MAG: histidine kinase [Candidatus Schekmanbacteria bacterium]|nr:histidine kinase [Candidatus Schekmanbacteria bacterium]
MPITLYITDMEGSFEDGLEKGLEQGLEKGLEKGREEGVRQRERALLRSMVSRGLTVEQICELTGMAAADVRRALGS